MYGGAEKANAATRYQRALCDNQVFLQKPEISIYFSTLPKVGLLFKILTLGLVLLTTMILNSTKRNERLPKKIPT